jgi:hypothetical protein
LILSHSSARTDERVRRDSRWVGSGKLDVHEDVEYGGNLCCARTKRGVILFLLVVAVLLGQLGSGDGEVVKPERRDVICCGLRRFIVSAVQDILSEGTTYICEPRKPVAVIYHPVRRLRRWDGLLAEVVQYSGLEALVESIACHLPELRELLDQRLRAQSGQHDVEWREHNVLWKVPGTISGVIFALLLALGCAGFRHRL